MTHPDDTRPTPGPREALLALLDRDMSFGQNAIDVVDAFLGDWDVVKKGEIDFERRMQSDWQSEAKMAFVALILAAKDIDADYPALKIGPRLLETAVAKLNVKGYDGDELIERMIP